LAVIIGDIHGEISKVRVFLAYKPQVRHVFLGDLADNRKGGISLEDELECLDLILSSDSDITWGNHDLAYVPARPWRCYSSFIIEHQDIAGYTSRSEYLRKVNEQNGNLFVRDIFEERYLPHFGRIKAAHAVDGWLCTHAGVSPEVAGIIPAEILRAGTQEIADWLQEEFLREMQAVGQSFRDTDPRRFGCRPLFKIPKCRGGLDTSGGIFWFDPIGEESNPSPLVGRQIFGHTPVPYPEISTLGTKWVNLNAFEDDGIWIYDTEEDRLIDLNELAG